MSDLRQCTRDFLTEFIELYKSLPCLWRVKTKEYSDRDKKTKAYETMVRKFREVDPNANRETVTKKINSLRSVYRKEVMKINKSVQMGAVGDDVYKPNVWYFDMFSFLKEQESSKDLLASMDTDSSTPFCDVKQEVDEVDGASCTGESESATPGTPHEDWSSPVIRDCLCRTSASSSSSNRKRVLPPLEPPAKDPLQPDDDSFDVFGKHVANKLRTLTTHQNIFAVKLINDVLFEAEMQSLDRRSMIVTSAGIPAHDHEQALGPDGPHC